RAPRRQRAHRPPARRERPDEARGRLARGRGGEGGAQRAPLTAGHLRQPVGNGRNGRGGRDRPRRDSQRSRQKEETMATQERTGSAGVQGKLWGARAADWVEFQESQVASLYDDVIERLSIGRGTRLLDAGCGAGAFAERAARAGADVSGLDASPELIAYAHRRVPSASWRRSRTRAGRSGSSPASTRSSTRPIRCALSKRLRGSPAADAS